jgi:hypothetical protein
MAVLFHWMGLSMKATIWHLNGRGARDWCLELRGELLSRFDYKDDAIRDAAWRARTLDDAQLIIHRLDGSIERELRFAAGAIRPAAGRPTRT